MPFLSAGVSVVVTAVAVEVDEVAVVVEVDEVAVVEAVVEAVAAVLAFSVKRERSLKSQ